MTFLLDVLLDHHPAALGLLTVTVGCLVGGLAYLIQVWLDEIRWHRAHQRRMAVVRRQRY
jgi:hypothetical protein